MARTRTKKFTEAPFDSTESSKLKSHLRLVYDKENFAIGNIHNAPEGKSTSVAPFHSHPNGESIIEMKVVTEQGHYYLYKYHEKLLSRNELYRQLKKLWGEEIFEGTRHCFENMKQRTGKGYATLDLRFSDFPDFLFHMGPRPYKQASIHRKDNAVGYSPENCEWASKKTQSRERTNSVNLTYEGETRPLTEWAEFLHLPAHTLRGRRERGWNDAEIILGKKQEDSYPIPADTPWPEHSREMLEKEFRNHGGKTREERFAYLLKKANLKIDSLLCRFRDDWTYPYALDEKQMAEFKEWDRLYELALSYQRKMTSELKLRGRHNLLDRCNDRYVTIVELFARKKRTYSNS